MASEAQFVTLMLGKEIFAVPVEEVREILDFSPPSAIPEAPAYLLGLTDVRGQATPTIDLRLKLGLAPKAPDYATRILVLDVAMEERVLPIGLVADRVLEVVTFKLDEIEPPPEIGTPWRSHYIRGVVRSDKGFVVLFELARLLSSQETAAVNDAASAECAA